MYIAISSSSLRSWLTWRLGMKFVFLNNIFLNKIHVSLMVVRFILGSTLFPSHWPNSFRVRETWIWVLLSQLQYYSTMISFDSHYSLDSIIKIISIFFSRIIKIIFHFALLKICNIFTWLICFEICFICTTYVYMYIYNIIYVKIHNLKFYSN